MVFRGKKRDNGEKTNGESSGIFGGFSAGGFFGGDAANEEASQLPVDMAPAPRTDQANVFAPTGQQAQQAPIGQQPAQAAAAQFTPAPSAIQAAAPANPSPPQQPQSQPSSLEAEVQQARLDVNAALDKLTQAIQEKEAAQAAPPAMAAAQEVAAAPSQQQAPIAAAAPVAHTAAVPAQNGLSAIAPAPGLVPPAGIPASAIPQPQTTSANHGAIDSLPGQASNSADAVPSGYQPSTIVGIEAPAQVQAEATPSSSPLQQAAQPAFEQAPSEAADVFARSQEPVPEGLPTPPQPQRSEMPTSLPPQRSITPEDRFVADDSERSANGSGWYSQERTEFSQAAEPATAVAAAAVPQETAMPEGLPAAEPVATVSSTSLFGGAPLSDPPPAAPEQGAQSAFGRGEAFPEIPFPTGDTAGSPFQTS